jgi:hypothetical protein
MSDKEREEEEVREGAGGDEAVRPSVPAGGENTSQEVEGKKGNAGPGQTISPGDVADLAVDRGQEAEGAPPPEPEARGRRRYVVALMMALLFAAGLTAGYMFFIKGAAFEGTGATVDEPPLKAKQTLISLYYPYGGRLNMEERSVPKTVSRISMAEAVVREFLGGPADTADSYVPAEAELLGIFSGRDGMLYVNLSDEFRNNFQGDTYAEFLLLRGFYESLVSNVFGVLKVKLLIEGEEVESIGGHLSARKPLGEELLSQRMPEAQAGK